MFFDKLDQLIRYRYFLYLLLVAVLYHQAFWFDSNLDDFLVYDAIPKLSPLLDGIKQVFNQRYGSNEFRPVTIASFLLEYHAFGELNPSVSHGINVVLYLLLIFACDQLLLLLSGGRHKYLIFLSLCLFITHPLHAEVVASIKSRDGILSMLFGVTATILLLKGSTHVKGIARFTIGLILIALALLSKLDAAGFVLFVVFYKAIHIKKRDLLKLAALSALFLMFLIIIQNWKSQLPNTTEFVESYVSFTENPMSAYPQSILNKVLFGSQTCFLYFEKIFLPWKMQFYYGYDTIYIYPPNHYIAWLFLVANIFIIGVAFRIRKSHFLIFLSIISIYIFLLFASNIVTYVAGIIAERYAFMATLWFCFLIVLILYKLQLNKAVFSGIILSLALFYSVFAYNRIAVWENKITLMEADLDKIHNSYEALRIAASIYYEAALELEDSGKMQSKYFTRALSCASRGNDIYATNSVMNKLEALINYKLGNLAESTVNIRAALKHNPEDKELLTIAGDLMTSQKKYGEAVKIYKKGLELYPYDSYFIYSVSNSYYLNGDYDECREFNLNFIAEDPSRFEPWENLAYLHLVNGDTTLSITHFREAVNKGMPRGTVPIDIE